MCFILQRKVSWDVVLLEKKLVRDVHAPFTHAMLSHLSFVQKSFLQKNC